MLIVLALIVRYLDDYCFLKNVLRLLVGIVITAGVFIFIYIYNDIHFDTLSSEWASLNKVFLVSIFILSAIIHIFVGSHKLYKIMNCMGVGISYYESLLVRLGTGPLRAIMPFNSGELINMLFFCRYKKMVLGRASGAILFDKFVNMVGVLFWLLLGLFIQSKTTMREWCILFFLAIFAVFLFFNVSWHHYAISIIGIVSVKASRFVENILSPLADFSMMNKVYFVIYGVIFSLRPIAVCFLLFYCYNVRLGFTQGLSRISLAIFAGHIPGAFAGMGPREWALCGLLNDSASKEVVLSVGILMSMAVHFIPMLLGVPWVPWVLNKIAFRATPEM